MTRLLTTNTLQGIVDGVHQLTDRAFTEIVSLRDGGDEKALQRNELGTANLVVGTLLVIEQDLQAALSLIAAARALHSRSN